MDCRKTQEAFRLCEVTRPCRPAFCSRKAGSRQSLKGVARKPKQLGVLGATGESDKYSGLLAANRAPKDKTGDSGHSPYQPFPHEHHPNAYSILWLCSFSRVVPLVRTYWRCCQCALVAPFCGRWALSNTTPTNDTQLPLNPHRSMRTCAVLIRTDENRAASQSCRASSLTLQQNVASKHKHTVVLCSLYIAVQCFYSVWFTPPRLPRHIVQSKWNRRVRPISLWQQWKKGGTQRS